MKKPQIYISDISSHAFCSVAFLHGLETDLEALIEDAEKELPRLKAVKNPSSTQIKQIKQYEKLLEIEEKKALGTQIHEERAQQSVQLSRAIVMFIILIILIALWLKLS